MAGEQLTNRDISQPEQTVDISTIGIDEHGRLDKAKIGEWKGDTSKFDQVFTNIEAHSEKKLQEMKGKIQSIREQMSKKVAQDVFSNDERAKKFVDDYEASIKGYQDLLTTIDDEADKLYVEPSKIDGMQRVTNFLNNTEGTIRKNTVDVLSANAAKIKENADTINTGQKKINQLLESLKTPTLSQENDGKVTIKQEISTSEGLSTTTTDNKDKIDTERKSLLPTDELSVPLQGKDRVTIDSKDSTASNWGIKSGDLFAVEEHGMTIDKNTSDEKLTSYLSKRSFTIWKKGSNPNDKWTPPAPGSKELNVSGAEILKRKEDEMKKLAKDKQTSEFKKDLLMKNGNISALNISNDQEVAVLRIQPGTKTYQVDMNSDQDAQQIFVAVNNPMGTSEALTYLRSKLNITDKQNAYFAKAGDKLFVRVVPKNQITSNPSQPKNLPVSKSQQSITKK